MTTTLKEAIDEIMKCPIDLKYMNFTTGDEINATQIIRQQQEMLEKARDLRAYCADERGDVHACAEDIFADLDPNQPLKKE